MGGTESAHRSEEKHKISWKTLRECYQGDIGVGGKNILKYILNEV
jgi:hypothetical protein